MTEAMPGDCPVHSDWLVQEFELPPSLKHEVEAPESSTTVTAAEAVVTSVESAVWV